VKEKPTVGYTLFWALPSDRTPKLMNDVNVHFLCKAIPVNYTSELVERFEETIDMVSVPFHLLMTYAMPHTSVRRSASGSASLLY
jgi:hypothetical protein